MYNITWDKINNGILLTEHNADIDPPRPVFFEELDLLGFDKYWKYPKSKEPLLWAIRRNYYYKGQLVARTKGGNLLESPQILIKKNGENLELEPINIEKVLKKNQESLFVLENETLDFIEHTHKIYKKEGYSFAVSFSGGKDSHVLLDLVTRILPSDDIVITFSDTTLENKYTYQNVNETIIEYTKKYPNIQFIKSKPPKRAIDFFKEFGLPSRVHRWCTPILKTAPFNNLINISHDKKSNILVFEGVRSEESQKRSNYDRIAGNVKHHSLVNARPILYWNVAEVFLYTFYRNLRMNMAYRFGLSRVGCMICPASSEWSEFILSQIERNSIEKYIPLLNEYAHERGLKDKNDINRFIAQGQWKKRAGGKGIINESNINFSESNNHIKGVISKPKEDFLEWIKVLGNILYNEIEPDYFSGELKINDSICSFKLIRNLDKETIEISNINGNPTLKSKLRRILYKTTYCVHCGVCKAECSTGALETLPQLHINSHICIKCGNCIYLTERGCLVSKSIYESVSGSSNMNKKTGGIDKYSTFGIREEWINEFFNFGNKWFEDNSLGPKQIKAMIRWLIDAELIEPKTKEFTDLGNYLKKIYKNQPIVAWSIIWNNIYYNSPVINWYCDKVEWNSIITKNELKEKISVVYPDHSKGTLSNPIDAMVNTFDRSPIGSKLGLGILEKKGRVVKSIKKYGVDTLNPFVIAYCLYKLAENYDRYDFTVSELYSKNISGGPYKLFGIPEVELERILRGLQEDKDQILNVDLNADLDNIRLRDDILSIEIAKIIAERG